jgi:hypothetical protein
MDISPPCQNIGGVASPVRMLLVLATLGLFQQLKWKPVRSRGEIIGQLPQLEIKITAVTRMAPHIVSSTLGWTLWTPSVQKGSSA